jgi:hypothetical protein
MAAHRFLTAPRVVRAGAAVCAVGALWAGPAPAGGQTVEQYRARVNRLLEVWSQAREAADSADDALRANMDVETIRFGTLVVLAHPERAFAARLAARGAWRDLEEILGRDTVLLDSVAFYLPERYRPWAAGPLLQGRSTQVVRTMATRPDILRRQLLGYGELTLSRSVDSIFRNWLHGAVPVARATPDLEELHVEFVTAPSPLVRDCRLGDLPACRRALVFADVKDKVREWYDAEGRAQLIRGLPGLIRQDREAADVCLERGWDDVCIAILQGLPSGPPPPLAFPVRASLVRYALERGGDGAYGRLFDAARHLADSTMIPHVIATAAGVPIDTLLDDWRTAVVNARPERIPLRLWSALVAVLWITGLFGTAMRNTRWR